jgi:hypothetical protein
MLTTCCCLPPIPCSNSNEKLQECHTGSAEGAPLGATYVFFSKSGAVERRFSVGTISAAPGGPVEITWRLPGDVTQHTAEEYDLLLKSRTLGPATAQQYKAALQCSTFINSALWDADDGEDGAARKVVKAAKGVGEGAATGGTYCMAGGCLHAGVLTSFLKCDHCHLWYHQECLGLKEPIWEDQGAGVQKAAVLEPFEVAPDDFKCPLCCFQSFFPYPFAGLCKLGSNAAWTKTLL